MSKYWLMKSEPDVYSIDHLKNEQTTVWSGVRNYQARNFMMKDMAVGDWVLFYHSNAEPPGIVGLAKVAELAQPDPTQFDKKSEYYEKRATPEAPVWYCVRVKYYKKFKRMISLSELKQNASLKDMLVLKPGQRLSVQPVEQKHFNEILKMAEEKI